MKWKPIVGIAAVVTAGATVGLVFVGGEEAEPGGDIIGGNRCDARGTSIEIDCRYEPHLPDPDATQEAEIREKVALFAEVPPEGDGPWPFIVLGSDIGLKVRSSNVVEADQLGGLQERHVAWVECQQTSTFDPDPTTGSGPVWYRVKWAQQEPSIDFFESDPGADDTAWAYAGYLVPWGHNGDIPIC